MSKAYCSAVVVEETIYSGNVAKCRRMFLLLYYFPVLSFAVRCTPKLMKRQHFYGTNERLNGLPSSNVSSYKASYRPVDYNELHCFRPFASLQIETTTCKGSFTPDELRCVAVSCGAVRRRRNAYGNTSGMNASTCDAVQHTAPHRSAPHSV